MSKNKHLKIKLKGEGYNLVLDILDRDLIKMYEQNQKEVINYTNEQLSEALKHLKHPSHFKSKALEKRIWKLGLNILREEEDEVQKILSWTPAGIYYA